MIKNNHGVTLSILVVTIIVIVILAGITITTSDTLIKNTKSKAIISNMYLIKVKVETIYEDYEFSETGSLPGTNVSVSTLDEPYGVDSDGVTDTYWYEWDKDVIISLGFDENMLSGDAEYIVNYETGEVIYTEGFEDSSGNIKYKLSDVNSNAND